MPELSFRRRQALALLGDGERYAGELAAASGRDQTNVCRDLQYLRRKGLVERRYVGIRAYYRAIPGGSDA